MRTGSRRQVRAERLQQSIVEALEARQLLATIGDTSDADVYWGSAGQWVESGITIGGAPVGAIATSALISWKLDGYSMSTVSYRLEDPTGAPSGPYSGLYDTGGDPFSGYPESNSGSQTITLPANTPVNGTWFFGAMDTDDQLGMGRIDSWSITITYTAAGAPEIQVVGGGWNIVDGDTTPSTNDNTNFRTLTRGSSALGRAFEVKNAGTAMLTLGSVSVPAGYSITQNLPSSIAPGDTAVLIVSLGTAAIGIFSGDISLSNNDADENPFNFRITGTVQANQAPTSLTLSSTSVAESQPAGTTVGTFTTTDAGYTDTFTYTLVSSASYFDNAFFQIVNNTLQTTATFDREAKGSYSIRVRSTDQGGLYYEKTLNLTITNVNEAPTDIALSSTSVNEGQLPGSTVGTFWTSDPDFNDTFAYTLVAGAGADDNASFMLEGGTLKTAAIFTASARNSYSIRVRATDAGGLWVERAVGIAVTTSGIPALAWSSYIGGSSGDTSFNAAFDLSGNAWVVGVTRSAGWVSGGFDTSFGGGADAFVAKVNADGTLAWSTYLGGSGEDCGYDVKIDASGTAWVTGSTTSSGWVSGGFDTSYNGSGDAFVAKIYGNGTLAWSSYLGGSTSVDSGRSIALDASGNAWLAGETSSGGWASGGFDTSYNGGSYDGFVAKINANGTLGWSTYLGGSDEDRAYDVAVDASGGIWVSGYSQSTGWVSGGFDTSYNGSGDAFVARINDSGTLHWSGYLGGSGEDRGYSIATDASGNAWVTGATYSSGWTSGGFDTSYNGGFDDAFIAKIGADGTVAWSTYLGGGNYDYGNGVALDADGNAWIIGSTASSGWASGGFNVTHGGHYDTFLAKINANGMPGGSSYLGGYNQDEGLGVAVDATGNVWLVGFTGSPGWVSGGFNTNLGGTDDGFLAKVRINRAPTAMSLSSSTVGENQPAATAFGILSTQDPDVGERFTYSLISGTGSTDNALFTIVDNELRTAAVFDYETRSSYSIRVRSMDQGGLVVEDVFTVSVTDLDEIAPTVVSVVINDGAVQRSMVKKLAVTFSEAMNLATGALTVKLSSGQAVPNTTIAVANPSGDQKTYLLSFSGIGVIGGSLADGVFDLVVTATGAQDLAGNALTADYTQRFHRLFGDSDGNRIINSLDYARLKQSFGRAPSDPLFNGAFDYEGNGLINALDLARFRQRYGMSYSY